MTSGLSEQTTNITKILSNLEINKRINSINLIIINLTNMAETNNRNFQDTNKLITKHSNLIINSLNFTQSKSAKMLLHDLKNVLTTELGYLKSNLDGAIIGYDALLRQYTKRMILQMGAESNLIFKDLFAAADRNTIQNRDVIFRAYQRIAHASREI
jgi:hypothetical protein